MSRYFYLEVVWARVAFEAGEGALFKCNTLATNSHASAGNDPKAPPPHCIRCAFGDSNPFFTSRLTSSHS
jgi:hypothetical protein